MSSRALATTTASIVQYISAYVQFCARISNNHNGAKTVPVRATDYATPSGESEWVTDSNFTSAGQELCIVYVYRLKINIDRCLTVTRPITRVARVCKWNIDNFLIKLAASIQPTNWSATTQRVAMPVLGVPLATKAPKCLLDRHCRSVILSSVHGWKTYVFKQ